MTLSQAEPRGPSIERRGAAHCSGTDRREIECRAKVISSISAMLPPYYPFLEERAILEVIEVRKWGIRALQWY